MKGNVAFKLAFSALIMFVSISSATQRRSQGPMFVPAPGSPVTVGPDSGEIVLADFNRDGHLDMLTKHLLSRIVAVRLGDGKGRFAPLAEGPMSLGYQPGAITLGDVNNDNILDLGIAGRDDNREYVHVFLGNGTGGFSPVCGSPFTASASIKTYKPSLHFVDVNEDGKPDIVTANGRRNSVEVLFGDGRGGFSAGPIVRLESGQNRYYLALGDVDGDRHLDLVTVSSVEADGRGHIVIKRGDGKGAFADTQELPLSLPPGPRIGRLADVNGDHHLDIVLSDVSKNLSVLLNRGRGEFTPAPGSPYRVGGEAFAVVVADVNGDKKNDLIAATVNSVTVLLGDGRGFVPAPGSPFSAGPGAYNVAVGDINEDGKLDVAASSFEGNAVTVLLGR
ncbi:MAG TPA: VCBS repeat-containing protein [Blastocatellia bacterium]|nr:VCBS repeat-containing protein [Blastocatellia bacterium]